MPEIKRNDGSSKYDARKIAAMWLGQGIMPVPLRYQTKKPKEGDGWNKRRVSFDTIPLHFSRNDNVGGLWGSPSKGIVDVDLDWDEASKVAIHLLPETFVYGRVSRPGSHFLIRCHGVKGQKRALKKGGVISEIRADGSQSVLPPSIHPDGDRYEFYHETAIADMDSKALEAAVTDIAIAAVFLRSFPDKGSRHDYIHAITGAMMNAAWPEKRIMRLVRAIILSSDDDDPEQRLRTVTNTIEHQKSGDRVMGWKSLETWVDKVQLDSIKRWLSSRLRGSGGGGGIIIGGNGHADKEPPTARQRLIPPFPMELLEEPGLVGDIARWSGRQSFLKQPAFELATGLMTTALASSNKYLVAGWDTPLSPYFMLVAPTAWGKEAATSNVYRFAKAIEMGDHVYQGFQSYYALLDCLTEPPHLACWLWDEAAQRLSASRHTNSPDHQTVSHLISLYGKGNDAVAGAPGRKQAIEPLEKPFLTLLATAQPNLLIEAITVSAQATGFVNRMVLFDAGEKPPVVNPNRQNLMPSSCLKLAKTLRDHQAPEGRQTSVRYDTPSLNLFTEFDASSRVLTSRGDEFEIWGRANQNALIVAGILAVGRNPKKPMITLEITERAVMLVRWSIACWMARIGESASRGKRETQSKRVEGLIRRAPILSHRSGKDKYRETMVKGEMPKAVLQRMTRDINLRDLDDILDQMIEAELISVSEDEDGMVSYWPMTS